MRNLTFTEFWAKNGTVRADSCVSIAFFRPTGANAVSVDGVPIEEGMSLTISQNQGDVDISDYKLIFTGTASSNALYVIKVIPQSRS